MTYKFQTRSCIATYKNHFLFDLLNKHQRPPRQLALQRGEPVSLLGLFKKPNLRKRVLISCALVIGQQTTGVNAFLGYAATLFKHCGLEDPILFNSIFNSISAFESRASHFFFPDVPFGAAGDAH